MPASNIVTLKETGDISEHFVYVCPAMGPTEMVKARYMDRVANILYRLNHDLLQLDMRTSRDTAESLESLCRVDCLVNEAWKKGEVSATQRADEILGELEHFANEFHHHISAFEQECDGHIFCEERLDIPERALNQYVDEQVRVRRDLGETAHEEFGIQHVLAGRSFADFVEEIKQEIVESDRTIVFKAKKLDRLVYEDAERRLSPALKKFLKPNPYMPRPDDNLVAWFVHEWYKALESRAMQDFLREELHGQQLVAKKTTCQHAEANGSR